MSNVIGNIFRIPELRSKVIFTLLILVVYRIGAHIPIPGIDVVALKAYFADAQKSGILDFFDLFAGGALKRFTIFALGIMPYISASIILDLMKVVFPYLENLSKEGAEGQKKLTQLTKYGTIILCMVQSIGITSWLSGERAQSINLPIVPDAGPGFFILSVVAMTTGTMILMWLGEIITERGIGNGISLIIFAGIVVRMPQAFVATMKKIGESGEPIVAIILVAIFLGVIAASILLTTGARRIPIQYGKKVVGGGNLKSDQYIPLKVNAAGVIPIIFASAIIMFPSQIFKYISTESVILNKLQFWISPGHLVYMGIYSVLIIFFSFFYTAIKVNPVEMADNLKKYGGFIPGIRPGGSTSSFIMGILNRITLSGSIFLALIAIVPDLIIRTWPEQVDQGMAYLFGGTSLLIIVGVALDTLKQIESQLMMRHYEGFVNKGKIQGRK